MQTTDGTPTTTHTANTREQEAPLGCFQDADMSESPILIGRDEDQLLVTWRGSRSDAPLHVQLQELAEELVRIASLVATPRDD